MVRRAGRSMIGAPQKAGCNRNLYLAETGLNVVRPPAFVSVPKLSQE